YIGYSHTNPLAGWRYLVVIPIGILSGIGFRLSSLIQDQLGIITGSILGCQLQGCEAYQQKGKHINRFNQSG
ncbi:MAG: hypothetical protein ACK55Z_35465, partial [bacterium]